MRILINLIVWPLAIIGLGFCVLAASGNGPYTKLERAEGELRCVRMSVDAHMPHLYEHCRSNQS